MMLLCVLKAFKMCQVLNNMKKKWAAKAAAWLDKGIAKRLPWTHRFLVPAAMRVLPLCVQSTALKLSSVDGSKRQYIHIYHTHIYIYYIDGCQMTSVTRLWDLNLWARIAFVSPRGRVSKIGHGQNCVSAWSTEWWSSVLPLWFSWS